MTETVITTSEIFSSIEGEAKYTGWPTMYVRLTGCNFECRGFNNPDNLEITNEVLGFNPGDYSTLAELPPVTISCDSIYSWDDRFKHMWHKWSVDELAEALVELIPGKKWVHQETGQPYILSITGGEPTLRAKQIIALLEHPLLNDLQLLLIETNCSVPLHKTLIDGLVRWDGMSDLRKIIWSNSPKLSASGEPWEKAIRPDVASAQWMQLTSASIEQYFKFVCGDSDEHFEEVARALDVYRSYGLQIKRNVYIMPMSCVTDQQTDIAANVARRCIEAGYIYCHRVHLDVFSNAIGT